MRLIRLNKTEDIAQVIQYIKELKDREVVFELERGSPLLASSSNLKLMKKTGEVLGKKVRVRTSDPTGRALALKAEVLEGGAEPAAASPARIVRPTDVRPRFSDIKIKSSQRPAPAAPKSGVPLTTRAAAAEPTKYIKSAQDKFLASTTESEPRSRSSFSKIFLITIVVLVLVVFGLAVLLPTADITVYARSEPISRDAEVTLDKSTSTANDTTSTIPAQIISREVSQTKSFPATGTKDLGAKSTGSVTLYNFTKNTLTLKAATTTLLANGQKFVFVKDVTGLRPTAQIGTGADQSVDPTSLIPPVAITAVNGGDAGNLPANTKFTIINAALGNQNVYGINQSALSGGVTKTVKVVSQSDLDNALAAMTDSIPDQAASDINSEDSTGGDIKILSGGITKEVLAHTASKNAGDTADSFDMTVIAKASGLSFRDSDVKALIKQKITDVLSDDKYLLPDAKDTATETFKSVDLTHGTGVLSVHYETTAAYKVDTSNLPKILAGKNANEIKEILLAKPEIDRVDVEFKPFFVNKAPKLNGKIYIHSTLSQQ